MRILYFYQYFTTPRGSWGTRAYEFARRWVEAGHEVTVVTSVYDKSDLRPRGLLARYEVDGIDVRVINVRLSNKHGLFARAATFLLYAFFSKWYAVTLPADVVLASSGPLTVGLPALAARWLRRRPFVFEVRDLFSEGLEHHRLITSRPLLALIRRFENLCYRQADLVVALSPGMAEWIRRDHCDRHVAVVPNASDNALFGAARERPVPAALDDGRHHFLYTGTIGTANDCGKLVDAAVRLRELGRRDVVLDVVGDGKERAALEARAAALGLENLRFHGLLPKDELAAWLAHCRAALLVMRDVPVCDTMSPNKMFDAFAAGVPVIQTTQGWIRELLADRRCGLTTDPRRPESLVEHILRLADDDILRDRLAANAAAVGRELFDRDHLAAEYLRLLEAVAR